MKVGRIDRIFGHLLVVRFDLPAPSLVRCPDLVLVFLVDRNVPFGRLALHVMPNEDEPVYLLHVPDGLDLRLGRDVLRIRHLDALTRAVELPRVEGTLDTIADHLAAETEVRSEMRAIGVEHVRLPVFAAEEHHVFAEIMKGQDAAGSKLIGVGHLEPTVRIARKGVSTLAHRFASALFSNSHKSETCFTYSVNPCKI